MTVVRRAPGDLDGLDALETDALVLPMFAARAQPLGVAGYADWRLSGRLARLIRDERFRGEAGESLLTLALGRIDVARVFLLGLGPATGSAAVDFSHAVDVLADAEVGKLAFGPPAPPEAAAEDWTTSLCAAWIRACGTRFDDVVVLDPDRSLEAGAPALKAAAKQAGATWKG